MTVVKGLLTESFGLLLGTKKIDGKHLPGYPMGIGEGTDAWPKDPGTGKPLVRFDWRLGKHDDPVNAVGLREVANRIREVGPKMGDAVKLVLNDILPGQLEKAVREKYMRMANEYRKVDKKRKRVDEEDDL
ncbi:hypothetical protein HYDPIDRAFT_118421, partial [Hydnomerulius pinastri MD-312]